MLEFVLIYQMFDENGNEKQNIESKETASVKRKRTEKHTVVHNTLRKKLNSVYYEQIKT
jgi:hypothetical protein